MNGPEVALAGAHNHKRVLLIVLRIVANPIKLTDIPIPHIVDSIHLSEDVFLWLHFGVMLFLVFGLFFCLHLDNLHIFVIFPHDISEL